MRQPLLFKLQKSLGPLEENLLHICFSQNKFSVRDVFKKAQTPKPLAYTTVMTVLNNLYKKGFLKRSLNKKTYIYSPAIKKQALIYLSIKNIMINIFSDYGPKTVLFSFIYFPKSLIAKYKNPLLTGFLATAILVLFFVSLWDLWQNGYWEEKTLILTALWEDLPIISLLTSFILLILTILTAKKILKKGFA